MSTIKITQLNEKVSLDTNTSNTVLLGVDLPTSTTVKFTLGNLITRVVSDTATGSYSNSAFVKANAAFLQANTPSHVSNSAAIYANGAFAQANAAFIVANTPPAIANSAALYANGAFIQANAAFIRANTPPAIANSAALYANGAFVQANASFIRANTPPAIANSAALYANGAFVQANAAFIVANTPPEIANSAALYANGSFEQANAAYYKANNALANTSGTFDGDLTVTGNLSLLNGSLSSAGNMSVNGTIVLANSNFSPTEAALTITASPTVVTPSNDGYMIHISGKNGVPSRVVTDSYGANSYVVFAGRAARGNVDYPSALQANDVIARFSSNGYGTTKYQPLGVGRIDFVAAENFTDANTGSRIEFYNCPLGSNTLNKIASFNGESVRFTGAVEPEKGFIYAPRILSGNQTAITIDFATDSMIRANFNSTLTISLSNYVYGKVVEVWVTNTAGNGQTINLGALANNTTTGSSTLTVAAGRSAKLQYFSVDGDQANTFLAITYA